MRHHMHRSADGPYPEFVDVIEPGYARRCLLDPSPQHRGGMVEEPQKDIAPRLVARPRDHQADQEADARIEKLEVEDEAYRCRDHRQRGKAVRPRVLSIRDERAAPDLPAG